MASKKSAENDKSGGEEHLPTPFTMVEAGRKIRDTLRDGDTIFSQHLLDDIKSGRHGVSHQDVLHVLKTGKIISNPKWDDRHRNWKYKVEGTDLEDEEKLVAITIIIEERFAIFIVTAY